MVMQGMDKRVSIRIQTETNVSLLDLKVEP